MVLGHHHEEKAAQEKQPEKQEVQQQEPEKKEHHASDGVKKLGGKFGNAAVFGAGASIGSDIVNSIL